MGYVLLIRHGQNDWVKKKRLAGWMPGVHLNQEGLNQAELLATRLANLEIRAVYSSPLERCVETAQIIAKPHNLDVAQKPDIGEVRYGDWEGKKLKKLARKKRKWYAVQHYPSRFRFPGGESFNEVQMRAVNAIEELNQAHEKEIVAVISHADVIKLILANYLGMHIDLFQRLVIDPASVSLLAVSSHGPVRVLRINDAGPLTIQKEPESTEKNNSSHRGQEVDHNSDLQYSATNTGILDTSEDLRNEDS
jgi:probable phosphoglycerate mutase